MKHPDIEQSLAGILRALWKQQAVMAIMYEKISSPEFDRMGAYTDLQDAVNDSYNTLDKVTTMFLGDKDE